MSIWDLTGLTEQQRSITQAAIDRCVYPWDKLREGLVRKTGRRDTIPVEWADLSRYVTDSAATVRGAKGEHDHDEHIHPSPPGEAPELPEHGHVHVIDEAGDKGHGILFRQRVLGLAWYSGRISIEASLIHDPQLAMEVFLAEAAHMVDFFGMSAFQREAILNAYHGGQPPGQVGHPSDWFEEGGDNDYADWCGESFMIGFTKTYSDLPIRFDQFTHKTTPMVIQTISNVMTPWPPQPQPAPDPPPPVEPPPIDPPAPPVEPTPPLPAPPCEPFGFKWSKVYHCREHGLTRRRRAKLTWPDELAAQAALRSLCRTCQKRA